MKNFQPGVEEPEATAEQLIDLYTQGSTMTAKVGKRLGSPIYSALSTMAQLGLVDDDREVYNEETDNMNTLYKLLKVPRSPRPPVRDYKAKWLAALEELKLAKEETKIMEDLATEAGRRYAEALDEIAQLKAVA